MTIARKIINFVCCSVFILYWIVTNYSHKSIERVKSFFSLSTNQGLAQTGMQSKIEFANHPDVRQTITLCAVGDLIFEKKVLQCLQRRINTADPDAEHAVQQAYNSLFVPVRNHLKGDIVYGNLETTMGRNLSHFTRKESKEWVTIPKPISSYCVFDQDVYGERLLPNLNNHPALAKSLKENGFDLVSTANNHSCDRLSNGIDETLATLDAAGIRHVGTASLHDAKSIKRKDRIPYEIITVKGIRLAFFAYTQRQNPFFKQCSVLDPCQQVNRFSPRFPAYHYYPEIESWIRHAREQAQADFVVISAHWGMENTNFITPKQKRWGHKLCEAGADIILGHHPHALQPMQKYVTSDGRETLIIYSMGNFIAGIPKMIHLVSAIFYLELVKTTQGAYIKSIRYVPTYTRFSGEKHNLEIEVIPLSPMPDNEHEMDYVQSILSSRNMYGV